MSFIPLHVHSEYSLLDGCIKIDDLINYAKEHNYSAVNITDHGNMYGAIELYKKAQEAGLKPIIGVEFYLINGDITQKNQETLYHIVLIAKNITGYKNLIKLVSESHLNGFYYKPRINYELLKKHKDGLICLSACIGGIISKILLNRSYKEAFETAKSYREIFRDDFYIELQNHGIEEQKKVNPQLLEIARELNIECVITNDSHYISKENAKVQDILLCLQTNKTLNDPVRFKFPNHEFYLKTPEELEAMFEWMPLPLFNRAIENTVKIADKCNLKMELGKSVFPEYEIPPGFRDKDEYLQYLANIGLKKRYGEVTKELQNRLDYELSVIKKMDFATYFLVIWDFIKYAKDNDIPIGAGRGSAAGSLAVYCLEITDIDPIKHNLLFERFLNPERYSMPDIDIDFCINRRQEVIDYVVNKYGSDKVCQIITFGTLAARAAIKAVSRILDVPYLESDKYAKMIPAQPNIKIKDVMAEGMELRKLYDKNPLVKKIVDYAMSVEGIKYNIGTHAAGIVISKEPLNEMIPVQISKDDAVISQYEMGDIESVGLLKMDFLGLRNLTIIKSTLNLIKNRYDFDLEINKIPLDDKEVYEMLSKGETDGVFQLESSGMKNLAKSLRPSCFEDINAMVALYRPGALNSGMLDDFVSRKNGKSQIQYVHPKLENVLGDTYGTIVYQEQIMQTACVLANYTMTESDELRKGIGKKKIEIIQKHREKFIAGCIKYSNMAEEDASKLYDVIECFGSYGFNRSHSAAYAFLAYQTAYLKVHYPIEYMSSLLSSVKSNKNKTQQYLVSCRNNSIKILPPDINYSDSDFTPNKDTIRFGLASIKNIGENLVENIIKYRKESLYQSFQDFCEKLGDDCPNKKALESLIRAGAFSCIEDNSKKLIINLDNILTVVAKENKNKANGQIGLFCNSSDKLQLFKMNDCDDFTSEETQKFEKELLGFYITSHPLDKIKNCMSFMITNYISELLEMPENSPVTICGLITSMKSGVSKTGKKPYKICSVEDFTGNIEVIVFGDVLEMYYPLLSEGTKIIATGKTKFKGEEETSVSIILDNVKEAKGCALLHIYLDNCSNMLNYSKKEIYDGLKRLLKTSSGYNPVIFHTEKQTIIASPEYWIKDMVNISGRIKEKLGIDSEIVNLVAR